MPTHSQKSVLHTERRVFQQHTDYRLILNRRHQNTLLMTSRPPFPFSLFSIPIQVTVSSVYCFQCVVFKADGTRHVKTPTFRNCFEIHVPCSMVHLYKISTCTVTVKPTAMRELLKINNLYCVPYTNLSDSVLKYGT